ncbi:CAP domain-containing protein [Kribbella antibiotica]|uniref:CAP domain-containing protein n=1 Tax=Kribbella antibiotica TaxID=190195 RepID=A0A4R4YNC5_9ACTN|nr:CAP domain-containing protein [Kribbella antibiotica]TDD45012.1 CAP domain-containing protein [Kribbella antibiotica]
MTNPRRSPRSRVAGPLLAAFAGLIVLSGIGWFVLRDLGDQKVTGQEQPLTTATDDASTIPTPTRPTTPSVTPRHTTPTPTKAVTKTPTPTPTRSSTAPSREGTRKPTTQPPTRTATPKASKPTKSTTTTASGGPEAQVLTLTNAERKKAGCGALRTNSALAKAAQAHASDMVDTHYFAHNSQDGRTPFARMKSAGFKGGAMAENIAVGYTSPAVVVKGWMNSPGHRANILNCSYTMLGVGYDSGQVKSEWGKGSWVQDFGG